MFENLPMSGIAHLHSRHIQSVCFVAAVFSFFVILFLTQFAFEFYEPVVSKTIVIVNGKAKG